MFSFHILKCKAGSLLIPPVWRGFPKSSAFGGQFLWISFDIFNKFSAENEDLHSSCHSSKFVTLQWSHVILYIDEVV